MMVAGAGVAFSLRAKSGPVIDVGDLAVVKNVVGWRL